MFFGFVRPAVAVLSLVLTLSQPAEGISVGQTVTYPALRGVHDVVFDADNIAYISRGQDILRYDPARQRFMSPIRVGGVPFMMDLAPNGRTLAVADRRNVNGNILIRLVDLPTRRMRMLRIPRVHAYESATRSVAWDSHNRLLVTSSFNGSGFTPLRRWTPQTGQFETLVEMLSAPSTLDASADRGAIAISGQAISSGPVDLYDASTGTITRSSQLDAYILEAAISRDGGQYLVPSYFGAQVRDGHGSLLAEMGDWAVEGPLAAAYSPVDDIAYVAWSKYHGPGDRLIALDTLTLESVGEWDVGELSWTGPRPRMAVSPDGSIVGMAMGNGGIRFVGVGGPPAAPEPTASPSAVGPTAPTPAAAPLGLGLLAIRAGRRRER